MKTPAINKLSATNIKLYPTVAVITIFGLCFAQPAKSFQEKESKTEETVTLEFVKAKNDENRPLEIRADVIQHRIDTMMQNTASWLDNIASGDDGIPQGGAAANGYVQFGWMPRTGDLSEFDPKFKVHLRLPRWNNKVALVLDNDDEDELKLDYEASSLADDNESDELNLAIQYVKKVGDSFDIKYRLGTSRGQVYARSEIKTRWISKNYGIGIVPRLDYFNKDGWAPSIKASFRAPLDKDILSFSASWQKVEKEQYSRQKIGLYYASKISEKNELVAGLQYFNNEDSEERYLASIRHRSLLYKQWLFFELEPFLEFKQEQNYRRELGLAIRLIGYYGP